MPRCVTVADFLGISSLSILISGYRHEVGEWELGRDVHHWLSEPGVSWLQHTTCSEMAEHAEKPPRDHPRPEHIPAGNHLPQEASGRGNQD